MDPISRVVAAGAAGAGAAGAALYVDDVFSTYLYGGNSSTQTITNEIDLSGEGGLTWIKNRNSAYNHWLFDTERGANEYLRTDSANAGGTISNYLTAFNSNGFTLGSSNQVNDSGDDYASWTFRKAPGFFDVVTYAGNSTARTISHNLGSVPGMIIVRAYDATNNWYVWHNGISAVNNEFLQLNASNGTQDTGNDEWNSTEPTSTNFSVGTDGNVNLTGRNYIAYIFAHDDQSFGTNSDEAIIKCGSYTGNGSTSNIVTLGFEPQWLLVKRTDGDGQDWHIFDVTRGMTGVDSHRLYPNKSNAEESVNVGIQPLATGFDITANGTDWNGNNYNYIYVAIRRPHKPPEAGTDVYDGKLRNGVNSTITNSSDIGPLDFVITKKRTTTATKWVWSSRLLSYRTLQSDSSAALNLGFVHGSSVSDRIWAYMDAIKYKQEDDINQSGHTYVDWFFKRAAGFLDVVTWSGNGSANRAINHNLGAIPELYITKRLTTSENWIVTTDDLITSAEGFFLNGTNAKLTGLSAFNSVSSPTSSVFYVGSDSSINGSSNDYIAYLFATLSGISKVGTYSGTGSNVDVDCGFTAGARFVLIKRTDSTADWYVWDSDRGIVSGNDPYLRLNLQNTETTSTDYIDPLNAGFTVTSSAPAALNTSGGTYLFLAIA
tara:strand:+ start:25 stop:2001 length:1977 start_codon:yes stop_codon:yes gene_type:complete